MPRGTRHQAMLHPKLAALAPQQPLGEILCWVSVQPMTTSTQPAATKTWSQLPPSWADTSVKATKRTMGVLLSTSGMSGQCWRMVSSLGATSVSKPRWRGSWSPNLLKNDAGALETKCSPRGENTRFYSWWHVHHASVGNPLRCASIMIANASGENARFPHGGTSKSSTK